MSNEDAQADNEANRKETTNPELVWRLYFPRLCKIAKKRMGAMSKLAADEEDLALSSIKSFFGGLDAGRFEAVSTADDLWNLLLTILCRKIIAARRRQSAQKRSPRFPLAETDLAHRHFDRTRSPAIDEVADRNQMPENPEQVRSYCEDLLARLPNDKLRQTAILRMDGYTHEEISRHLGGSVARSKQRVRLIKEIWSEFLTDQSG